MSTPHTNIAAVVPVLNPEPGLLQLCKELTDAFGTVIVVNDGSDEHVEDFDALPPGVILLHHEVNQGKGRAIKTALRYLIESVPTAEYVIFADGDGQHRIEDILKVADRAMSTGDITVGIRNFTQAGIPFRNQFGNLWTAFYVWLFCHIRIRDTQTGLRAFPRKYFEEMTHLSGEGYEYEMHLFGFLRTHHATLQQVPIQTIYQTSNRTSHFQPWNDTVRIYKVLLGDFFRGLFK